MHISVRSIGFFVTQIITVVVTLLVNSHRWLLRDTFRPIAIGALASLAVFVVVLVWLYRREGRRNHVRIDQVRLKVTVAIVFGIATLWLLQHAFHWKALLIIAAALIEAVLFAWTMLDLWTRHNRFAGYNGNQAQQPAAAQPPVAA